MRRWWWSGQAVLEYANAHLVTAACQPVLCTFFPPSWHAEAYVLSCYDRDVAAGTFSAKLNIRSRFAWFLVPGFETLPPIYALSTYTACLYPLLYDEARADLTTWPADVGGVPVGLAPGRTPTLSSKPILPASPSPPAPAGTAPTSSPVGSWRGSFLASPARQPSMGLPAAIAAVHTPLTTNKELPTGQMTGKRNSLRKRSSLSSGKDSIALDVSVGASSFAGMLLWWIFKCLDCMIGGETSIAACPCSSILGCSSANILPVHGWFLGM